MKIGIITFHWATNYGAVLQSLALQTVLARMEHDVKIINYKPKHFDISLWQFVRGRHFLHPKTYLNNVKKEKSMRVFREKYLHCTKRFYSIKQLQEECNDFDVLITGSDQVMNPSFLKYGEKGGSGAYFLDFGPSETKRIAYAVSFGTTKYPTELLSKATSFVRCIDKLSVRETTGVGILASMGRGDSDLVPDPTLLLKAEDYDQLLALKPMEKKGVTVYMLHNRLSQIASKLPTEANVISSESVENWIAAIKSSSHLVTNSFHGMVFALLYHVPFTIVLRTTDNVKMNDRFFTLLTCIGLQDRIVSESNFSITTPTINWQSVDQKLEIFKERGMKFLQTHI